MEPLRTRGLEKCYGTGPAAVSRLDLTVQAGEIFGLLGPNGAGKTTTIHMLLGLIEPSAGDAWICDVNVRERPLETKRLAAFVSENVRLYENLSALRNASHFARLAGQHGDHWECRAALRRVGLEERAIDTKVGAFSKGMKQKVGLAIALLKKAPVVLLDEPTSGLDPGSADEFLAILRELRAEGKAILMSSHDLLRVGEVSDRVGIMQCGRLQEIVEREQMEFGNLAELYRRTLA